MGTGRSASFFPKRKQSPDRDRQGGSDDWRGRDYVAWFTKEIPIRRGPWKFGGLPGLIVQISDAKKEYNFELVKLERTKRPMMQYNFSQFKKVSRENMLRLQKKINVNWVRVLSPEAGSQFPDHPYNITHKFI